MTRRHDARWNVAPLWLAAAGAVAGCAATSRESTPAKQTEQLILHQHWLEHRWSRYSATPSAITISTDAHHSPPFAPPTPDFDDPASVLLFILANAPQRATVYPTERYFYYRFNLHGEPVSGNLRFTSIERGVLHIGHFDERDLSRLRHADFGPEEGVRVSEVGPRTWRVECGGIAREFTLTDPRAVVPPGLLLAEKEELVSGVIDESGFVLGLIWDEEVGGFFFAMPRSAPWPDTALVEDIGGWKLHRGAESGFIFLEEPELDRLVLVGVAAEEVARNSYFDGPFDQVPPDLPLRERLEKTYPYVVLRGGIDDHGVFRHVEGQRVAISPYVTYRGIGEVPATLRDLQSRGVPLTRARQVLTFEPKRLAHMGRDGAPPATLGDVLRGRSRD